jgi:hypothetical protein
MEGRIGHQDALFPTRVGAVIAPGSHGVGMGVRKTHSLNRKRAGAVAVAMLVPVMALAQYPGQVSKKAKGTPDLRAIAVLEWTGEVGKPKACRMVPVMVYDGEKLQDAGIYLARPQPLALSGEVEYELKANGKTFGFFDIENAGQEQGSWVGYGKWKPMPAPKAPEAVSPGKVDDFEDEKPVLHRKQHSGESSGTGTKSGDSSATTSQSSGSDDPDRPKLQKKSDDGKGTSGTTASGAPPDDPDRPKLQKKPDTGKPSSSSPDSDQPTLQKSRPNLAQDIGDVSSVSDSDPDRPKLKRGKSSGNGLEVVPTLMGLPPDMQQAVAVSDSKSRPDHSWTYSWANPDDENKMKAAVEEMARQALGLTTPAPVAAPAPKRTGTVTRKTAKTASPPPQPAPLEGEEFRVFELAYGSGATLVLTAHTDGPPASQKFVTIVAQPDLYGKVRVLLKSVTDRAHLDETPRMRLVDAVDALADNRGELLFELRGDGSRQFALYRIYGGTAEKLFVSSGGVYGTMSSD